jgi:hypothetical protein
VVEQPAKAGPATTTWARVKGVGELKHTLIEVILVYLVVDFATDLVEAEAPLSWQTLVIPLAIVLIACVPLAIVLIACALRLLGPGYSPETAERSRESTGTPS